MSVCAYVPRDQGTHERTDKNHVFSTSLPDGDKAIGYSHGSNNARILVGADLVGHHFIINVESIRYTDSSVSIVQLHI